MCMVVVLRLHETRAHARRPWSLKCMHASRVGVGVGMGVGAGVFSVGLGVCVDSCKFSRMPWACVYMHEFPRAHTHAHAHPSPYHAPHAPRSERLHVAVVVRLRLGRTHAARSAGAGERWDFADDPQLQPATARRARRPGASSSQCPCRVGAVDGGPRRRWVAPRIARAEPTAQIMIVLTPRLIVAGASS